MCVGEGWTAQIYAVPTGTGSDAVRVGWLKDAHMGQGGGPAGYQGAGVKDIKVFLVTND